ncbi:MAG TPA: hypothetical protein VN030_04290 [Cellvibrio sp.]|nr:hypothetical protein [Cellvibrio sp.]
MNELQNSVAILGKPYTVTRSKLGAITKIFNQKYTCDLTALKELFQSIGEKLSRSNPQETPKFSFLISFDDKTHHDGISTDFQNLTTLATGKLTDRVVLQWSIIQEIDGMENELSITVRVANPINPLMFLQAALSKSPSELDNSEFESGATCVTVNGATQSYSDEIFLIIERWTEARNKPYTSVKVSKTYERFEWYIDQFNSSILPTLVVSGLSFWLAGQVNEKKYVSLVPLFFGLFYLTHSISQKINAKMAYWARKSSYLGIFQITNGDVDSITKMMSAAQNGAIKLIISTLFSLILNIIAGIICWRFLPIN